MPTPPSKPLLIVDAQASAALAMAEVLRAAGLEVLICGAREEARRLIVERAPRLLLLDVSSPQAVGGEVLGDIRRNAPPCDAAVLLLSSGRRGSAEDTERWDAQAGGADGILVRPLPDQELLARVRDVLRERELLRSLRESQRRHELILGAIGEGVHGIDAEGRIIFENPAAAGMFGWSPREMIGRDAHSTIHHHHADGREYPARDCAIYATLRDGQTRLVKHESFFRKDGSRFPVEYLCAPMRGASGRIEGAVVTFRDVTEQHEAVRVLRQTQDRHRSLFEQNLIGNFVCDPQGRLLLCNPSFAAIHGFGTPAAAVAAAPALFGTEPERERLLGALQGGGATLTHERWIAHPRGLPVLVLERLVGVQDGSGRLTEVQGYHLDVTERRRAEDSMRAQATLLSNAERLGRMGSWSLDIADERMVWSEATCALFGIAPGEFQGTRAHFYEFVLPEDRARLATDYARVVESRGLLDVEVEFRIRRPDGAMRWMMVRGNAQVDADGRIGRRFGMFMDITERKLAEERILRLNRVQALLSAINAALVRIRDRQDLFDTACRIAVQTGRMRAAWVGLIDGATVRVVAGAGDLHGYHEAVNIAVTGLNGNGPYGVAVRESRSVVCNDVEHDAMFAPWRAAALARDFRAAAAFPLRLAGKVIGALVHYAEVPGFFDAEEVRLLDELAANISFALEFIDREQQRRLAEQALRDSEERFRAMYEQAALGICLISIDYRFLRVNRRFCEIVGREADELLAMANCLDITQGDDRPAHARAVGEVLAGAASATLEQRYVGHPAGPVWARLTLSALRSPQGEPVQFILVVEDVSERRGLEEQLRQAQRLEAVGQLTGGIAHDFNNLLTVILGNAELLLEEAESGSEPQALAQRVVSAALRGAELTQRLLAFARRQPLRPAALDVNQLIRGLDDLQRRTLGEHIEIEFRLGADLWAAMVDPGQLESALLNLAINARDAMPTGGRLLIQTANVTWPQEPGERPAALQPGQYVRVTVADTGIGIAAELLGRVFEPFFTTKATGKGTGLGLAMVYGFVRQSGGHVEIDSAVGVGTTVTMYLPRAEGGERRREIDGAAAAHAPTNGHETVLLVEDDELVRRYARDQLLSLGYRVLEAPNGPQALQHLRDTGVIDLLFTDVVMPGGISGRQLADAAQRMRPGLPVLFTSGYAENAITHDGRLDPGVHLLEKPYQRAELARKLREVLQSAARPRAP